MPKGVKGFQKGTSPNPSGRPRGIQDRRAIFRSMVESRSPELINKAVDLALDGNEQMLRLLLDRLLPAKPPQQLEVSSFERKEIVVDLQAVYKRAEIAFAEYEKLSEGKNDKE